MAIGFRSRYLKQKRNGVANIELGVLAVLIPLLFYYFPALSASCAVTDLDVSDDLDWGFKGFAEICLINRVIEILCYAGLGCLGFCSVMLASTVRATPTMWLNGLYATQDDGLSKPGLLQAFQFMFLGNFIFVFACSYAAFHGFSLSLSEIGTMSILLILFAVFIPGLNRFGSGSLVFEEYVSGLRLHLTDKAQARFDKRFKRYKWLHMFSYGLTSLLLIPAFLLMCFMAFNALNVGERPADYDEYVYKSAQEMHWQDNAYFALSGLNAPEDVEDFYTYGLQHAHYYAKRFEAVKKKHDIPFMRDVPDIQNPINQDDIENRSGGIEDDTRWDCFYKLPRLSDDVSYCEGVSAQDFDVFITQNKVKWARFNDLPNYTHFALPDTFLAASWKGQDLIKFAQVKTAEIVILARRGDEAQAISEWIRFMALYQQMVGAQTNMVEKAIFMLPFGVHMDAIEILLNENPVLVRSHGQAIKDVLTVQSLHDFRGDFLLRDDWRIIGTWIDIHLGDMPHKKRAIHACMKERERVANLPDREMLTALEVESCPLLQLQNRWPLTTFTSTGEPISNIIWELLVGGILKGRELVKNMHYGAVKVDLLRLTLDLANDQVSTDNLPEPYLWDGEKKVVYYPQMTDQEYNFKRRSFVVPIE